MALICPSLGCAMQDVVVCCEADQYGILWLRYAHVRVRYDDLFILISLFFYRTLFDSIGKVILD